MLAFLACAVFGGVLLVAQLLVGAADGAADGGGEPAGGAAGDVAGGGLLAPLNLFGLRALAAAVAFFGVGGAAMVARGAGRPVAIAVALLAGTAAAVAVAALTRLLLRFERDGAVRLPQAVGAPATVYLRIPPAGAGAGKVHLTLQGRLIEASATAADDRPLPTGAPVLVIDVRDDVLVVVADPTTEPTTDGVPPSPAHAPGGPAGGRPGSARSLPSPSQS